MPLFEQILGRYGGEAARQMVDLIISRRIQGTTNVERLVSYESAFDPNTREYSAMCVVHSTFGTFTIDMLENLTRLEVEY